MDRERQQRAIDEIAWYHDFDFGDGLRATSSSERLDEVRPIWRFIEQQLDAIDFRGKSVLEIGTWDGYWSFYAERRGAAKVLATDDLSQNWAAGDGVFLARQLLGSNIEIRQDVSIYDLTGVGGTFDIILCLGVFYHLHDPFYGLTQLRHRCHRESIVILEGSVARGGLGENRVHLFHSQWLEFLPSASALRALAKASYLSPTSYTWMRPESDYLPDDGTLKVDRALMVCAPLSDLNDVYDYRPPHGLQAYDPRFSDGFRAELEITEMPGAVAPGQAFTARLRVRNRAWYRWTPVASPDDYDEMFLADPVGPSPDEPRGVRRYRQYLEGRHLQAAVAVGVHLSSDGGATMVQRDYARGFLPSAVEAGQHCDVTIAMRAPNAPGTYAVTFDMVSEYVAWFAAFGSPTAAQSLVVKDVAVSGRPATR